MVHDRPSWSKGCVTSRWNLQTTCQCTFLYVNIMCSRLSNTHRTNTHSQSLCVTAGLMQEAEHFGKVERESVESICCVETVSRTEQQQQKL